METADVGSQKAGVGPVLGVCGATDIGLRRKQNEDAFVIVDLKSGQLSSPCADVDMSLSESGYLLLVCDGMGGAAAGDVASHLAATSIWQKLVGAGGTAEADAAEALGDAVAVANRAILNEARARPKQEGMGTTCTAVIVRPGTLTVAQVGDSRAYLLHEGKLRPLTKDQSLARELQDAGVLTADQARTFPMRNVLSQALGTKPAVAPVISEHPLAPGDRLLICSDGLHGSVPDTQIKTALDQAGGLTNATKALVDSALAAGGSDNVTVVVAEYRATAARS